MNLLFQILSPSFSLFINVSAVDDEVIGRFWLAFIRVFPEDFDPDLPDLLLILGQHVQKGVVTQFNPENLLVRRALRNTQACKVSPRCGLFFQLFTDAFLTLIWPHLQSRLLLPELELRKPA